VVKISKLNYGDMMKEFPAILEMVIQELSQKLLFLQTRELLFLLVLREPYSYGKCQKK
jgi:hypothetical protein